QRHHDRESADELRNQAVLQQILRLYLLQDLRCFHLGGLDIRIKADGLLADSSLNDFIQSVKCAAADEQDVRRIKLDKVLMRVLPSSLRWNAGNGSLQNLKQRLLNAFAADIPC